jgi:hypothetical protein
MNFTQAKINLPQINYQYKFNFNFQTDKASERLSRVSNHLNIDQTNKGSPSRNLDYGKIWGGFYKKTQKERLI